MEVYDYVVTKPELNDDTLAHFLGGAHKYLNKYMGKNGKWVYVYNRGKSKVQEAITKYNRSKDNYTSDPETITTKYGKKELIGTKRRNWSGKPNSLLDGKKGSRLNAGLAAGRYRAAQKKSVKRFRNTNTSPFPKDWKDLRFKGYSNSMTNAGERGLKVKSGIEAGRKRVAKKKKK